MKTIAVKFSAARKQIPVTALSDALLKSMIHGVGGSPRRAVRSFKTSPAFALDCAERYDVAIKDGTPHITAVQAGNRHWSMFLGTKDDAIKAGIEYGDDTDAADIEVAVTLADKFLPSGSMETSPEAFDSVVQALIPLAKRANRAKQGVSPAEIAALQAALV